MIGFDTDYCLGCECRFDCPVRAREGSADIFMRVPIRNLPVRVPCIKSMKSLKNQVGEIVYEDEFLNEIFKDLSKEKAHPITDRPDIGEGMDFLFNIYRNRGGKNNANRP